MKSSACREAAMTLALTLLAALPGSIARATPDGLSGVIGGAGAEFGAGTSLTLPAAPEGPACTPQEDGGATGDADRLNYRGNVDVSGCGGTLEGCMVSIWLRGYDYAQRSVILAGNGGTVLPSDRYYVELETVICEVTAAGRYDCHARPADQACTTRGEEYAWLNFGPNYRNSDGSLCISCRNRRATSDMGPGTWRGDRLILDDGNWCSLRGTAEFCYWGTPPCPGFEAGSSGGDSSYSSGEYSDPAPAPSRRRYPATGDQRDAGDGERVRDSSGGWGRVTGSWYRTDDGRSCPRSNGPVQHGC